MNALINVIINLDNKIVGNTLGGLYLCELLINSSHAYIITHC